MFKPEKNDHKNANVKQANENLIKIYKEPITLYEKNLADAKKEKMSTQ